MFFKVILYFRTFIFCSKCIFVFFFQKKKKKNWFRGLFAKSSIPRASRKMCLREIKRSHFSYKKSRYCLASISRLNSSHEMFLGKNWKFSNLYKGYCDCLTTFFATKGFSQKLQYVSRLCRYFLTREKCVFLVFM